MSPIFSKINTDVFALISTLNFYDLGPSTQNVIEINYYRHLDSEDEDATEFWVNSYHKSLGPQHKAIKTHVSAVLENFKITDEAVEMNLKITKKGKKCKLKLKSDTVKLTMEIDFD